MRKQGEILLVSCYEMGHQPWNLASPLAFLQQAGYAPLAIDTAISNLAEESLSDATLVAISVPMHTALRLGVMVAKRVRAANPAAHITFYGLYAGLNAEYLLHSMVQEQDQISDESQFLLPLADSVIAGEYEVPLLGLVQALEEGTPVYHVLGVSNASHTTAPYLARLAKEVTDYPIPQRMGLPDIAHYARFRTEDHTQLAGYVEATRGCLHTCLHCPITPVYQGRFFVVPREVVLADIRAQVAAGARHITFGDPDFFNGPGHVFQILRAMHTEFPFLTFDVTIKIEHLLEKSERLPELRELGCAFIVSAVESFSDEVLIHLNKGHHAADIAQALALTAAANIILRPTFVAFTPWTTLNDYLDMLDTIERLAIIEQIDPVQYSIRLLIPPGSALLDHHRTAPWLGPLDAAALTYRWTHPDPRMDHLQREIATLVERAAAQEQATLDTFYQIKAQTYRHAGRTMPSFDPIPLSLPRRTLPGLTESWFC